MAVYKEDKEGNLVLVSKGKTIEERVISIKEDNDSKGIKNKVCLKDILETKQQLEESGDL